MSCRCQAYSVQLAEEVGKDLGVVTLDGEHIVGVLRSIDVRGKERQTRKLAAGSVSHMHVLYDFVIEDQDGKTHVIPADTVSDLQW